MNKFQYPNITGRSDGEKIGQIVSFLRQLVDTLNYEGQDAQTAQAVQELGDKIAAIQDHLGMNN